MAFRFRSFIKPFFLFLAALVIGHGLIQVGYPMLKGKSFAEATEHYRWPATAIPIAVAIALTRRGRARRQRAISDNP